MKLPRGAAFQLSEEYMTVSKTYVLIIPQLAKLANLKPSGKNITTQQLSQPQQQQPLYIFSHTPITPMFEHIFLVSEYYEHLDTELQLNKLTNEQIYELYRN